MDVFHLIVRLWIIALAVIFGVKIILRTRNEDPISEACGLILDLTVQRTISKHHLGEDTQLARAQRSQKHIARPKSFTNCI